MAIHVYTRHGHLAIVHTMLYSTCALVLCGTGMHYEITAERYTLYTVFVQLIELTAVYGN